jgi:hypothetical protein
MEIYFQNLSAGIIVFYLIISVVISLFIEKAAKYILKIKFDNSIFFNSLTIILFLIFMLFVLTDEPYVGGR